MANVRAEILAASRSRTGWHDGMPAVQNNNNNNNHTSSNCRPYISDLKTSFEKGGNVATQEKKSFGGGNNRVKSASSPSKRPIGAKIEKMKKIVTAESNASVKRKPVDENTAPPIYKSDSLSRNESHLTRFNNARAMFERLEEQNARVNLTSPVGKPRRSNSGSSSPSRSSPLRSPCSPSTHSFDNIYVRRNSSSSNSSAKDVPTGRDRSHSSAAVMESTDLSKKAERRRSSGVDSQVEPCQNEDNTSSTNEPLPPMTYSNSAHDLDTNASHAKRSPAKTGDKNQSSPEPANSTSKHVVANSPNSNDLLHSDTPSKVDDTSAFRMEPTVLSDVESANHNADAGKRDARPEPYSWKRPGYDKPSDSASNPPYRYQSQLKNLSGIPRRKLPADDEKQKSHIPSLVSARERLGVATRTDFLIKPPSRIANSAKGSDMVSSSTKVAPPSQSIASEAIIKKLDSSTSDKAPMKALTDSNNDPETFPSSKNHTSEPASPDEGEDILCVSEDGIELIQSETRPENCRQEVNGNIISENNDNSKTAKDKCDKQRQNMMVVNQEKAFNEQQNSPETTNTISHSENAYKAMNEVANDELPMPKAKSDWRKQLFPDLDPSSGHVTNKIDDNLPESRVDDVVEEDQTVISGQLTYPEIVLRGMCHESATDLDTLDELESEVFVEDAESQQVKSSSNWPKKQADDVEEMTAEEANKFLSTNANLLSDEEAKEITELLTSQEAEQQQLMRSTSESTNDTSSSQRSSDEYEVNPESLEPENANEGLYNGDVAYVLQDPSVNLIGDGHYFIEIEGLAEDSDDDNDLIGMELYSKVPFKKKSKVHFCCDPIKVYSTHAVEDYDRRNEDVDPVSASAEYELEKRIEKMDVYPVDLNKGPEGLGLSIIGMGVGADAGLEKLGIFIKTITEGGAACIDGRIQVNDQIIEVDGKSLVGVTQAYAASVLRNTRGLVQFVIGREKDSANSEVARLISQSLEADKERDDRRRALEQELIERQNHMFRDSQDDDDYSKTEEEFRREEDVSSALDQSQTSSMSRNLPLNLNSQSNESVSTGTPTPEEGYDMPTCEVFDAEDATSSDYSLSPTSDQDILAMKAKLNDVQASNNISTTPDILDHTSQVTSEEPTKNEPTISELQLTKAKLESINRETSSIHVKLESTQGKCIQLEKKYHKAKKIIKEFQLREKNLIQREEFHVQQSLEKDQEYNSLVKTLKDRVILLEQDLVETQRNAGIPVKLPYDRPLQVTPQLKKKFPPLPLNNPFNLSKKLDDSETSDIELSDIDLNKYESSPDSDDADFGNRTSTVERKPVNRPNHFQEVVPETDLLDTSAAKSKAELASKGGLANRQPPTMKKQSSSGSSTPSHDHDVNPEIDEKLEEVLQSYNESVGEMNRMAMSSDSVPDSMLGNDTDGSYDANGSENKSPKLYNSFSEEIKAAVAERHAKVVRKMSETDQSRVMETEYERYQRECYERYYAEYHDQQTDRHGQPQQLDRQLQQPEQQFNGHNVPTSYQPTYAMQAPPRTQPTTTRPQPPQVNPYSQTQQHQLYRNVYNPPAGATNQRPTSHHHQQQCSSSSSLVTTSSLQGSTESQLSSNSGIGSYHPANHGSSASSSSIPSTDDRSDDGVGTGGIVLLSKKSINSLPRPQSRTYNGRPIATGILESEMSPSSGSKSNKYQINSEESDLESSFSSQAKSPATVSSSSYEMQRKPNQWQSGPVGNWSTAQVGQWLLALGLEQYIPKFMDNNITGNQLLLLDSNKMKSLGVVNSNDRSSIKKKVKEMKSQIEKERKQYEKEIKNKEKLAKKAAKKK